MSEKKTRKKKAKKAKRVKLEPKARIRRRLMKLWTMAVHAQFGEKCAVCGSDYKPNAHHIESRIMFKGLRYDPMNGVLLCPTHHKFGKDSAHMAGCWFANWLKEHLPERYAYVLTHHADPDPDLEDREILAAIEAMLRRTIEPYGVLAKPKAKPAAKPGLSRQAAVDCGRDKKSDLDQGTDEKTLTVDASPVREGEMTQAEADEMLPAPLKRGNLETQKENDEGHTADNR